jgi:hypothetical protein
MAELPATTVRPAICPLPSIPDKGFFFFPSKQMPKKFKQTKRLYLIALRDLLTKDGRTRSTKVRHRAGDKTVRAEVSAADTFWVVSGGDFSHAVVRRDGQLICTTDGPHHPRKPGAMCAHEFAVYKVLAWEHMQTLVERRNGKSR